MVRLRIGRYAAVMALAATALLGGCSSTPEDTYKEASADVLYNTALDDLHAGEYDKAAKEFDQVDQQHPYSTWATKAQLMEIYAQYEGDKYDDAISAADRFIQLHPGNRDVAYAYYLKAISYYEQIVDVGRDQQDTELAQKALQDVVTRFPDTRYARDARLKLDLTRDHLAGKEMEIGRYYEAHEQYVAAINRFRSVISDYQTTTHVPEALGRLAECYLAIGQKEEARQTAAVLGYNFPDSRWYKDTYDLVGGASPADRAQVAKLQAGSPASSDAAANSALAQGGDASDDKPGWFGRTFGSLF